MWLSVITSLILLLQIKQNQDIISYIVIPLVSEIKKNVWPDQVSKGTRPDELGGLGMLG